MLWALITLACTGWFIDKMVNRQTIVNSDNKPVTEIKNIYNPVELGYTRAFNSRYPWRTDKNHTIGDIDPGNPKPFIDIPELKRKMAPSDGGKEKILPDIKKKTYELIHERENLETHHKFDPDFGHSFPKMIPFRQSRVASLYQ